jgi:hypothetical protein
MMTQASGLLDYHIKILLNFAHAAIQGSTASRVTQPNDGDMDRFADHLCGLPLGVLTTIVALGRADEPPEPTNCRNVS